MKRGGFKRPVYSPPRQPLVPIPAEVIQRVSFGPAKLIELPKGETLQHAGYMDLVRDLRCYRCGAAPRSQFCHADEGKGEGIKSDCRLGWPGCWRCHYDIGTARVLPKFERRAWEAEAGRATRAEINRMGRWPASLPQWPGDEA